jgi:hypothetical protein
MIFSLPFAAAEDARVEEARLVAFPGDLAAVLLLVVLLVFFVVAICFVYTVLITLSNLKLLSAGPAAPGS